MISIVVASYNQHEWLPDALDSILNQTVKPYEVIVVDDGSTDGSLEIARKYPFKVISQVNKGLASARNTGIMNATGDYVFFLDSDDILTPNCIEKITKELGKADIIAPSFRCFGKEDDIIILMDNPTLDDFKDGNKIGYFSAFKRSKLLEVGGYSPRMVHGYEDLHLTINLLRRGAHIVTIPETLVLYRTKETSMWTEAVKHHTELMNQIYKDFPNTYDESR